NLQNVPSIFEISAAETLDNLIYPALSKIFDYFGLRLDFKLWGSLRIQEELSPLLTWLLQYLYLRKRASSFGESFYGLQRTSRIARHEDTNPWEQRLLSAFHAFHAAKAVHTFLYLIKYASSHSPIFKSLGLTLRYPSEPPKEDQWTYLVLKMLEVLAFFLQFRRKVGGTLLNPGAMPRKELPPEVQKTLPKRGECPVCLLPIQTPTACSVSGFVFCWKCIVSHMKEHGCCPVTQYPISLDDLVPMTILGKLRGEITDQEKVPLPMNLNDEALMHHGSLIAPKVAYSDNEADAESMVFNRPQHHCLKSFLLFLIAVVVMLLEDSMEMARVYPRSDGPFALNWRSLMPDFGPPMTNSGSLDDNYFREDIELDGDSDEEGYARVDVPDFKDGRRGRFMHDFKENQCFIMPLDRDTTLPPTSFADLMKKMSTGYYNIDTERVRRQMRVVTPRITDLSLFSERIANECYDMKVYMMEKFVSGISKRSADPLPDSGKYAEFMGKGVIEYDLANIAEVEAYEANEANQRA
ncbi:hypothetical protein M5D96_011848, partial [Drosophila gunungcola]